MFYFYFFYFFFYFDEDIRLYIRSLDGGMGGFEGGGWSKLGGGNGVVAFLR